MPRARSAIIGGVVSGLIVSVAQWAGRTFLEPHMTEILKSFVVTFAPLWTGVGVGIIVWIVLSIWRITRGRDDEFKRWLQGREARYEEWLKVKRQEIAERIENFMAAETANNKGWRIRHEDRIAALEARHQTPRQGDHPGHP
jgi:MFS superfamily sulfate permease-like transporter